MSKEVLEKIFIPYFSTKDTGSGLGLAIAKQGIEQSGGSIWVESSIDLGTTFFISLPTVN
jgi:signal transduction histidine kinase